MKNKVLQIYLSLVGLCQWIFLASGGSFVAEFLGPSPIKERLLLYSFVIFTSLAIGWSVYAKLFSETKKNK